MSRRRRDAATADLAAEPWVVILTHRRKAGAALKLAAPKGKATESVTEALNFPTRKRAEKWAEKAKQDARYRAYVLTVDRIA